MVKKRFVWLFSIISLAVVVLDQVLKQLISITQPVVDLGILSIHLVHNTGAGFGILQGQTTSLGIISMVVAIVIIIFYRKIEEQQTPQILFALLLGGVVGNGIDRVLRKVVVDFIDFSFWPAFNIADMAITVSIIGLAIFYWNQK